MGLIPNTGRTVFFSVKHCDWLWGTPTVLQIFYWRGDCFLSSYSGWGLNLTTSVLCRGKKWVELCIFSLLCCHNLRRDKFNPFLLTNMWYHKGLYFPFMVKGKRVTKSSWACICRVCTVAPNICVSSAWNVFHVTFFGRLDFWCGFLIFEVICAPLRKCNYQIRVTLAVSLVHAFWNSAGIG